MESQMTLDQLITAGERLGYNGGELQKFVREEQKRLAKEAAAELERQVALKREEAAIKAAERDKEIERAERQAQIESERAERQAKIESERAEKQAERERESRDREHDREIELLRARAQLPETNGGHRLGNTEGRFRALCPKLPAFDEKTDDVDAYLQRFERFAQSNERPEDVWGASLSPLLTGKSLQVYTSMPPEQANDYNELKRAILRRYQLTEEGFRAKFRDCKSERGENVHQFVARVSRYFDRWVELSEIAQDFDSLRDLLIREQIIGTFPPDMAIFVRERKPENMVEVTRVAEQYLEARGGNLGNSRPLKSTTYSAGGAVGKGNLTNRQGSYNGPVAREVTCFVCDKKGHVAKDCWKRVTPANSNGGNNKPGKRDHSPKNWRDRGKNGQYGGKRHTAALCQSIRPEESPLRDYIEGGQLRLEGGKTVPVISGMCGDHPTMHDRGRMPVHPGYIGHQEVQILRDTGCSSIMVKRGLVSEEQLTGSNHLCVLIDGTVRQFPLAKVRIDTPFYSGKVEAMCIEEPVFDLVVGNIPGARVEPDKEWSLRKAPEKGGKVTRAQAARERRPIKPLKVSVRAVKNIEVDDRRIAQKDDPSLDKLWGLAKDGVYNKTRGKGRYKMKVDKGEQTRVFTKRQGGAGTEVKQVAVPAEHRKRVMTQTHESLVGRHLDSRKTLQHTAWRGE